MTTGNGVADNPATFERLKKSWTSQKIPSKNEGKNTKKRSGFGGKIGAGSKFRKYAVRNGSFLVAIKFLGLRYLALSISSYHGYNLPSDESGRASSVRPSARQGLLNWHVTEQ